MRPSKSCVCNSHILLTATMATVSASLEVKPCGVEAKASMILDHGRGITNPGQGFKHWTNCSSPRPRELSFASIASIKSPRVQLPSTAGWQGPLADNSPSRPSVHHPVYDVSKGSDGDGSKPVYSLFLPQPFQKGQSHVSQKTPALAVSQRVNAHACLDSKTATHGAFQSSKKPQGKRLWYRP